MDKLDFLDGEESPIEEPRVEEAEAPEPVVEAVPVEPVEPAEPVLTVTAPVAPSQPEPGFVPIAVVLDTRDKLKAAEAELAQYRAQQQPQQVPDPIEDPEGSAAYQQALTQQAVLNSKLDISEDLARDKHGDATVDAAKDWALQKFSQSPAYQAEVLSQRNPYAYVVKEYQKEQTLQKLGTPDDIDGYLAWKAAQTQLQQQAAEAAPSQPTMPTRSIASATSAGGVSHVATGPGVAFGDAFGN